MVREDATGLTLDLQVVPRASRVAVGPFIGEGADRKLRVAVAAPPVDGKANAAVIEALAEALGVRRRDVEIVRGATGRQKTVRIAGLDLAGLIARLGNDAR